MTYAVNLCTTLETVDVECTHCGVEMTSHVGSGGQIRYHYCPSCARWTTSVYTEVLRADSKMRARRSVAAQPRPAPVAAAAPSFGTVKARLESWLHSLGESDPYRTLGVSPRASDAQLRERYLQLARQHHPDRGGRADDMRRVNEAWEKIQAQREHQRDNAQDLGTLPQSA